MKKSKNEPKKNNFFEKFANAATKFTGSSLAFIIAAGIVLVWGITGPLFHYSETWQLVINTGTTIITFLMVFLIQKAQNKDGKAIQLKLNELIAAQQGASNRMVDIEDLSEQELDQLHKFYVTIAALAKKEADIHCSHSIDVAKELNESKLTTNKHFKKK
ncbi:low affinity iron permease family protein [Pedobacter sandarakinus]|uniref:low affinity iron permease family protein n=1 Tax=Pedobacter sandarakinus TaxID=353156 RepID=UPI0022474E1E|nr:low affinity iron permease family protein [Pedobacter sandarakinus]MCX2574746.1 low affinity iron permease family protein [Pedobacter sandarakinus]